MKKKAEAVIAAFGVLLLAIIALIPAIVAMCRAEKPAEENEETETTIDSDDDTPTTVVDGTKTKAAKAKAKAEAEAAAAAKEKAAAKKAAAKKKTDPEHTIEELRALARPLVKEGRSAEIKEMLEEFGAETLSTLDEEHFDAVFDKLEELAVA